MSHNAGGITKPLTLSRKPWDADYKADRERIYTVLTIDGGGMRGMIPACVLEEVETAIKAKAMALLKESISEDATAAQRTGSLECFNDIYQLCPFPAAEDIPKLTYDDIHVDLADYFDLISGTSTGAILAAYLATKGGNCSSSILESRNHHYQHQIASFKENRLRENEVLEGGGAALDRGNTVDPGGATAAQALFAAAGDKIFTKVGGWLNYANWSLPGRGKLSQLEMMATSLYRARGIQGVLQEVLKDPSAGTAINMSDEALLHCSLLIPSFQIDHNRPVMFWHLHQDETAGGSSWGYSTINRLEPYADLHTVSLDDTHIVTAIAQAMAGWELLAGEQRKPFLRASSANVLSWGADRINTDILKAWDEQYLDKLADAVFEALPKLEGFDRDDLAEVIERALLLLSTSRFVTFREALTAAIVPQLRPDMLTSMYVLTKPKPQAAQLQAAGPADWVLESAQAAWATVADSAVGVLLAPARVLQWLWITSHMWGSPRRPGHFGAGSGGPPGLGSLDGVGWLPLERLPQAKPLPVAVPLPNACRFYEAQCGDSLHVYNVDFKLCEVVRASTAAPTFFSAAKLSSQGVGKTPRFIQLGDKLDKKPLMEGLFADGGVVANNPTMAAIAFLERAYGVHRNNIAVLSLGCGTVTGPVDVGQHAGGLSWAAPLISQVFMGSSIDTVTAVTEMMFTSDTEVQGQQPADRPSRYLRIQAVGFAPPENGWMHELGASLGFLKKQPRLQMHIPTKSDRFTAKRLRKSVNYLGIAPSSSSSVSEAVGSSYTNAELGGALQAMDRPQDWDKLRVIGSALGQHFKEDVRAWLDNYVLLQHPIVPAGKA